MSGIVYFYIINKCPLVWYLKLIRCEKCKYAPKVYIKRHDQYSMYMHDVWVLLF